MKIFVEQLIKSPFRFLTVLISLSFVLHLPFFSLPPCSQHVWRQCNTLAVAKNFCEEDMNVLKPRIDRRLNTNGVTGMQFPFYENTLAAVSKVIGWHEPVSRILSFVFFSIGVIALYFFSLRIFSSTVASAASAWALAWSPDLFYHSINALPDVTALSMMLCGLLFFVKWENHPRFYFLLICILCLTLAGLSKMQFASAYVFALVFAWMKAFRVKTMSKKQFAVFFISAVVSMGVIIWWYAYARELQNNSHLHDFVIQAQPLEKIFRSGGVLLHNFISDIPELLLNYSSFIILLMGVFFIFREGKRKSALFVAGLCWLLSLVVFHIVELPQMQFHNYYMLVELPVLILLVAYAAMKMHQKKLHVALVLLLVAQPVLAATRIIPSRWMNENKSVPAEFLDAAMRAELERATSPNELCVVGPDNSGCIFFYFMHKKGFGFAGKNDLLAADANGQTVLENYIAQGAKYFITNDAGIITDERFHLFFLSQEKKVGNFYVMRLNANK